VFTIPEPSISEAVAVVPGLDGEKMSKSYGNTIELFGDPKETRQRIMRIVTDSTPLEEPKNPDTCNIFALYKLFATAAEADEMAARYRAGNFGYGTAKKALAEKYEEVFAPMRDARAALAREPDRVEAILQSGARRARDEARKTLNAVRQAVGIA
jgi:tryptophanyl-tRNA synthetase